MSLLTVLEARSPDPGVMGRVVPSEGRDGGSVLGLDPGLVVGRLHVVVPLCVGQRPNSL